MESRRVFFRGSMFFGFFNPETLGKMKPKLTYLCIIWVFPKIGVPQNGWSLRKTLLELMIWGYPYFWKHPYVFRWVGSTKTTNSGYCKIQITSLHQKVPKVPQRREDPGSSGRWSPVFEWEKSCELWVGLFLKKTKRYEKKKSLRNVPKTQKNGELFFFSKKGKGDPNSFFVTGILPSKGRMTSLYFKKMAIATPKWWMSFWATNKPQKVTNSSRQFFCVTNGRSLGTYIPPHLNPSDVDIWSRFPRKTKRYLS